MICKARLEKYYLSNVDSLTSNKYMLSDLIWTLGVLFCELKWWTFVTKFVQQSELGVALFGLQPYEGLTGIIKE